MSNEALTTEERVCQRVVCAAVMLRTGKVICGVRHFDELMLQSMPPNTPEGREELADHQQGFVDNKYKFLTRQQAFYVALAAKQFDPDCHNYRGIRGSLFSEDLY